MDYAKELREWDVRWKKKEKEEVKWLVGRGLTIKGAGKIKGVKDFGIRFRNKFASIYEFVSSLEERDTIDVFVVSCRQRRNDALYAKKDLHACMVTWHLP